MPTLTRQEVEYPDSDGMPMSDNTLQFRWIHTLKYGIEDMLRDNPNVFVAGDLLWYPVEFDNVTRMAPDVLVAFGRPKGDRGSYRQWEEGNIPPQVVVEVLSPGNRAAEMAKKLEFYDRYGVEEYYIYDPDHVRMKGYVRSLDGELKSVRKMDGHVSPRLGITFDLSGDELSVLLPTGGKLLDYLELSTLRQQDHERAQLAEAARRRIEREKKQLAQAKEQAEAEKERTEVELARLRQKLRDAGLTDD